MLQSKLFTKTRREGPKDEVSKNAELLTKAGYIHKELAGAYSYLPLGLRVLEKINNIIRDEMNAIDGQELFLTVFQDKKVWEATGRWDDSVVDIWFKTKIKEGSEVGLGFTHEEPLTRIMKEHVSSYKDLPIFVYQLQTKFRNEARAKSGLLRGREFLMKDLYSFCKDKEEQEVYYERSKQAYKNVFERIGIGDITYMTFASGGSFSKYSHEFQTIADAGEDTIHICNKCNIAVNDDIVKEQGNKCPECGNKDLKNKKAIEVGNIFNLGTKFSEALGLFYKNEKGEGNPVVMGSYGIGPGRLMGTVVEVLSDNKGIVWPKSIAPFAVHLVVLNEKGKAKKYADDLYKELVSKNIEVLYDDRELSAGQKFADSDLIGIPIRLVVSEKTIAENKIELKERSKDDTEMITKEKLFKFLI